jgi:N-acetylmuramic acid 6-phosphate etherase
MAKPLGSEHMNSVHQGGRLADRRETEARNPRTLGIDQSDPLEIVRLIQAEDRLVPDIVAGQAAAIAELIERISRRLRAGGRLFYIGAGTSGRLGVLDASECPPTFGTDPTMVQGRIAGGLDALVRSQEGAEDDREAGRAVITEAQIGPDDFVLGIATSGTTPYVQAAVEEARTRGAGTGFLCCSEPPQRMREVADVLVTPIVGPEVIAGSTRMKAGTATKLVLNAISTGVMIRLGKVYTNLMVDLRAVSRKLVDRSIRIVGAVCSLSREEARQLLLRAGGSAKTAIAMGALGSSRAMSERALDSCDGFLGAALDRFGDVPSLPFYSGYPAEFDEAEAEALLARLTTAADALRAAVAEDAGRAATAGSRPLAGRWPPPSQVAHLIEFEIGAIQTRVAALAAGSSAEPVDFVDWQPSDPPPAADQPVDDLLVRFADERRKTVASLAASPGSALRRRARLGDEVINGYQFLRGVTQHDAAHTLRIRERVHPALYETS